MEHQDDLREIEKLRRDKCKAEKKDNLKEVTQLCNYIGELLAKHGKFTEALKEHETELALCEALCDTIGCAVACRKIGECYCGLEEYDKALNLQKRHLSLAQSCQNLVEQQRAWATIGRTYLFQTEAAKTKELADPASKQAENSFKRSLEICEKLKSEVQRVELMEMKARLYLNLGLVYDSRGDMTQCAEFMKRAITISEQHKLYSDLYRCQYSLSSMYQRAGDLSQAQRYLDAANRCAVKLKDKYLQNDVLLQKAVIYLQLGDYANSKHALKKAYKLGACAPEDTVKMLKHFRAVSKIEESFCSLNEVDATDFERKFRLFEKLGDLHADVGLYKQAIEFYLKMETCGDHLKKLAKEMIPIYVSLAQTFSDDKQYNAAIEYYKKEMACRDGDQEQMCRTWLNIADCEELAGKGYQVVSNSMVTAFGCANKAKHHKLQVHVLKSLIEVQKYYKQKTHRQQAEKKLQTLKQKYGISSDDELSDEEDSQKIDQQEEDALSIGDLTESDTSDEEGSRRPAVTMRNTSKRITKAKVIERNEKGETPLHRACIEGNLQKVKRLIEQGHPVNPRDYCGWIPLHEASNHDFYEIVAYLVDHGAAINDRGGEKCEGVTPLIDASNCGNLEIIRLLIEKGANVLAKDDKGNTALDCLREWKNRCESMDGELLSSYQEVELMLSVRQRSKDGIAKGHNSIVRGQQRQHKVAGEKTSDIPSLTRPGCNSTKRSRNLRRTLSDSEEENSEGESPPRRSSTQMHTVPTQNCRLQTDMYREKGKSSATETYKQVIQSVGSSAARRQISSLAVNEVSSHKDDRETSALISAEKFIDDDWLIDDMQPTKRRKIDMDGVFSTSTIRNRRKISSQKTVEETEEILSGTIKCRKSRIINSDDEGENSLDTETSERIETVNRRPSDHSAVVHDDAEAGLVIEDSSDNNDVLLSDDEMNFGPLPNLSQTVEQTATDPQNECNIHNFTENFNRSTSCNNMVRKSSLTKQRQLTMTTFGVRQTGTCNSRLMTNQNLSVSHSDVGIGVTPSSQTAKREYINHLSTHNPSQVTHDIGGNRTSVMRMKVRVKDKLLLVPIPNTDKSISWLCQEVTQRYYSLCGLRPLLTLATQDGAFLSPEDSISLVLSAGEEVIGSVEGWDVPPLAERYEQACKTLNTVTYMNVKTILKICDGTGVLDLSNLALRLAPITPVIKALYGQPNLTELILTGNRIGDGGIEELIKAFCTIPCLTRLNLSCNSITSNGIKHLADLFTKPAQQTAILQTLSSLDLSHNPLGDSSYQSITSIIDHFKMLTYLSLSSCNFSTKFFPQSKFVFAAALQKSNLQSLDLSYNKLGNQGVEFLKNLNLDNRITLEIEGNTHK